MFDWITKRFKEKTARRREMLELESRWMTRPVPYISFRYMTKNQRKTYIKWLAKNDFWDGEIVGLRLMRDKKIIIKDGMP